MSEPSFSELARRVAARHPDVASYRELGEEMLQELQGREADLLAKLLPGYMRAVLSRRQQGGSDEDIWASFLNERMPSERGPIFVREATDDDLAEAEKRRRTFAGNLDKRALQIRQVRRQMRLEGVTTAGEITEQPAALLREVEVLLAQAKVSRMKAERQLKILDALRSAREMAQEWVDQRTTPTVSALQSQHKHLTELISEQTLKMRRAQIQHEVLAEMLDG